MTENRYPRIVIAGTSSGVGKTTLTLAVMAALAQRGLKVQGFKSGPDFIDPGYYETVTGRVGRNLDTWMIGRQSSVASLLHAAKDADISVIEGVMGLYDGRHGLMEGSTADIAKTVKSPVVVTIDCAKMGGSAGAMALGYRAYDTGSDIRGFLLNNVGSDRHEAMVRTSVENATGLPVVGCIRRRAAVRLPERHLGLVTSAETDLSDEYRSALTELAKEYIDLELLLEIARSAPPLSAADGQTCHPWHQQKDENGVFYPLSQVGESRGGGEPGPYFRSTMQEAGEKETRVRIGVALDEAFNFYYRDNFDLLRSAGAELVFFSPLRESSLPDRLDGLYIGGGYPEVYARELAENRTLAHEIRRSIEDGMPVYAECGGLMYLSREVEDFDGVRHAMCGALPVECKMQRRPVLGYREAVAESDSVLARAGDTLRGHEFHYSAVVRVDGALEPAYRLDGATTEGFVYNNALASYIHLHFGGVPGVAENFVNVCESRGKR